MSLARIGSWLGRAAATLNAAVERMRQQGQGSLAKIRPLPVLLPPGS